VTNYLPKDCNILSSVRSADGEINLASFGSSGNTAFGAGVFGIVHLHALGGVLNVPPPPPISTSSQKSSPVKEFAGFSGFNYIPLIPEICPFLSILLNFYIHSALEGW